MISITSLTGSSEGVIFEESKASALRRVSPRITKSKTLDGGIFIDHRGVSEGDRELEIKANISEATAAALQYIYENETLVNLACQYGFYQGAISNLDLKNGAMELTFWVNIPITVETTTARYAFEYETINLTESVAASVA